MKKRTKICVALALSASAITPAQACWTSEEQAAATASNFNMMLMVSALRCRNGRDNFIEDYNRFVGQNNALLGQINSVVQDHYAKSVGAKMAIEAADQMNVGFANHYGGGLDGMTCADVKSLAVEASAQPQDILSLATLAETAIPTPHLDAPICEVRIALKD